MLPSLFIELIDVTAAWCLQSKHADFVNHSVTVETLAVFEIAPYALIHYSLLYSTNLVHLRERMKMSERIGTLSVPEGSP